MIKLILKLKDTQIEEFNLAKSLITIGRSKENEVVIDNIAISRKHAQVELKQGTSYVLRDLHSSNGTFLNGSTVTEYALRNGDKLLLGESLLVFHIEQEG